MIVKNILFILLFFFAANTQAEIVVVGNLKSDLPSLTSSQVENIFMGRTRSLPNGQIALPVDQSTLRAEFYQKLTTKPIEQVNAYWARIMFTGQASPPMVLSNDDAVLTTINENKDAIGYIDSKSLNSNVRVLLKFND